MFAILHLLSISVALKAFDEPQLLQVLILIRSADRAPLHEFSSAESARLFPRGLGEVTNEGLRRASQQGEAFKQRYTNLGLFMDQSDKQRVFIADLVYARRSRKDLETICLSGQCKPIIHTTEILKDEQVLIIRNSMEHRCKVLARHNISHEFCDPDLLLAEYIKKHPDCADFPYSRIEAALAEVENSESRLDSALAKCARGTGRNVQFRALSIRSAIGDDLDPDRLRTVIAPLISILSRHIDNAVRSELIEGVQMDAPVRIYVTHDHLLLAVAHVLGMISVYKGRSPKFSSAIAIETWRTNEGFDIKIVVKDGLDSAFNPTVYRYHEFMKQISPYNSIYQTSIQWDVQANTVYTIQNFEKDVGSESAITKMITGEHWPKQWSTIAFEILLIIVVVSTFAVYFVQYNNTQKK